ncbi:MAG: hypothetical protein OEY20_02885 [Gemmatimonadota bacterium]|nr:hypothetical protein [Gemmatimonadota bacterium]MDH4350173.1 hypothetical protein [Gemmatimonadota bacterium]MDH5196182.1 hypothetical protein [Gemmatimonadota bacterium]
MPVDAPSVSGDAARPFAVALDGVADFFATRETLHGVVARRLLGRPSPQDRDLADHLIRERRRRTRLDGSIGGALVPTAQALWELLELGADREHAAVVRLAGFLTMQQDRPGRWSDDGAAGDGFFSPGPLTAPIAPLALPSGTVFTRDDDARFVASCLALRAVLRAGHEDRRPVAAHLESLLRLRVLEPHLGFVVLAALGMAPPKYWVRIDALVAEAARHQRADGSWPDVTVFHAVDLLLTVPTRAARVLVAKAAPCIAAQQLPTGAFDPRENEANTLTALRALLTAQTTH